MVRFIYGLLIGCCLFQTKQVFASTCWEIEVVVPHIYFIDVKQQKMSLEVALTLRGYLADWERNVTGFYENGDVDDAFQFISLPGVRMLNRNGRRDLLYRSVDISADGQVEYHERFNVTVATGQVVNYWTNDKQHVSFSLQTSTSVVEDISFLFVALNAQTQFINLPDAWFQVEKPDIETRRFVRKTSLDTRMINQLIVDVPLSRKLDVQFWRFLLPLLAISLVSWSVLGVGDAFGQLLLCSGLLLALMTSRILMSQQLPLMAELMLPETIVIINTITVMSVVILVMVNHVRQLPNTLRNFCQLAIPIISFIATGTAIVLAG